MRRICIAVTICIAAMLAGAPSALATTPTCIIQLPTQYLTDLTPVTIRYQPMTPKACRALLVKVNKVRTGWARTHRAKIVATVPGKPICSYRFNHIKFTIYGKAAAKYVCGAFQ